MKIKDYYCLNCNKFLNKYQVEHLEMDSVCKFCGCSATYTKTLISTWVECLQKNPIDTMNALMELSVKERD